MLRAETRVSALRSTLDRCEYLGWNLDLGLPNEDPFAGCPTGILMGIAGKGRFDGSKERVNRVEGANISGIYLTGIAAYCVISMRRAYSQCSLYEIPPQCEMP